MFNSTAEILWNSSKQYSCMIGSAMLISIYFTTTPSLAQTNYYIANNGNDANNGTSPATPFQTVTKVNSLPLQPGDSILFRRGDTFRGTMQIQRSGSPSRMITYGAYGNGLKPVIAGSEPLSNWSSAGTNVWQVSCPSCGNAVTGAYKSGVSQQLGRYPNADAANKGNLTIRAHTQKYQIFSQERLPDGIDWKGGEVVMRPAAWILDRAVVDAQYGDALNLFNNSNYTPRDNSEYFFQNHPATLDRNGEWCYDKNSKKILLYSDQGKPADQLYTATVYGRGISINSGTSYINISNLKITETLNTGIYGENNSNLFLTNLEVTNGGEDGIIIYGSGSNILLQNSQLTDINNNGVFIESSTNITLRSNTIRRIGVIPGRGKSGDGQGNGIRLRANQNVLIEDNILNGVGYNGIDFSSNTTIQRNIIANCCASKVDGGGVYSHNGSKSPMVNIHILSNTFYTDAEGINPWFDYSIGIFLDDCVENVDIQNNTIFGHTQWGVFLHGANHVTFKGNTLFDNRVCQIVLYHNGGNCPIRGDIIKRNVIVAKTPTQMVAQIESNADDLLQYGTIDSNFYARPFNEEATIRSVINSVQGGNFNLSGWQNFSGGQDLHSKTSPITYQENNADGAGGVNRVQSTFDQDIEGWEIVYSRYGNATVAVDNTNKLDGGSIRFAFTTPSGQPNSYAQMVKRVGGLKKGKKYVLRFDAVASTSVSLLVHLRTYGPPFTEFGRRYYVPLDSTRKSFELIYDIADDASDAIIMMQTDLEGPVIWIDNVRLQEDVLIGNNPDDFVKLIYNPTSKDSTVALPTSSYRDVYNVLYANSLQLKPYTSVVLFKEYPIVSPADLSISLETDKQVVQINEAATFRLRIRNESPTPASLTRWTSRLPANMEFVVPVGQTYNDNVLTGIMPSLQPYTDTTFRFTVRSTAAGLFRTSAQITTATSPDPDSSPNTGTLDGEDDAAYASVRVGSSAAVYTSPNPNQRVLPAVQSNQPTPDPDKADLSLQMQMSRRTAIVGESIICTIQIRNVGGRNATNVQVQNQLPAGFELVDAPDWIQSGNMLMMTVASVPSKAIVKISFQIRITQVGMFTNRAQIQSSDQTDPNSTPGNGFAKGEDDEAQADVQGI